MQSKQSLKKELAKLLISICVGTVFLVGIIMISLFYFTGIKNTQKELLYQLDTTSKALTDKIAFIEQGVVSLRHNKDIMQFLQSSQKADAQLLQSIDLFSAQNAVQGMPFVSSVFLSGKQNRLEHYYPLTLIEKQDLLAQYSAVRGIFLQSNTTYQCIVQNNIVYVCVRLLNNAMQENGVLICALYTPAVEAIFADIQHYTGIHWALYAGQQSLFASDAFALSSQLQNSGKTDMDGMESLYFMRNAAFGTKVFVSIAMQNVYATLNQLMISLSLVLILIVIVAIIASYTFGSKILAPIEELMHNIRAFGKQDFHVRMQDNAILEFHEISSVFNTMASRIHRLITEVYEKQILASQAQVKYLQSQLNPHFAFNVLAMLSLKAKLSGNDSLYESIHAFSKLLQGKIFRDKQEKITVAEEMELVQFYLHLQKERFGNKLCYQIEYANNALKHCLIPRLLIEPMVENAIAHGMEPKKEQFHLNLHIYEQADTLHIDIQDDGIGYQNQETEPTKEHTHTSIQNIKRLLQILYANKASFHIEGKAGEGTCVQIQLPIERDTACGE